MEIKPLSQDMLHKSSASIDELRDAIGHMSSSNSAHVSVMIAYGCMGTWGKSIGNF